MNRKRYSQGRFTFIKQTCKVPPTLCYAYNMFIVLLVFRYTKCTEITAACHNVCWENIRLIWKKNDYVIDLIQTFI